MRSHFKALLLSLASAKTRGLDPSLCPVPVMQAVLLFVCFVSFYLMYLGGLTACMSVFGSLGTGVTDHCELPCG